MGHVCLFTWIDNLFVIAPTQEKAHRCMRSIERYLLGAWNLGIKASSKVVMYPSGATNRNVFGEGWQVVQEFPVLGHILSDTGGVRACWQACRKNMWRAFWGNCKSKLLRNDKGKSLTLLSRSVYPVLNFRVSRWPPQKIISQELDQTQAHMVASILRYRPSPGEDLGAFHRRRMRDARAIAATNGRWSSRWFDRFERWNEHLHRHPDHSSTRLLAWKDAAWLRERRATSAASNPNRWNAWSCLAGRTDTRCCSGYVAQRWESGREYGRETSRM